MKVDIFLKGELKVDLLIHNVRACINLYNLCISLNMYNLTLIETIHLTKKLFWVRLIGRQIFFYQIIFAKKQPDTHLKKFTRYLPVNLNLLVQALKRPALTTMDNLGQMLKRRFLKFNTISVRLFKLNLILICALEHQ